MLSRTYAFIFISKIDQIATTRPPFCVILRADSEKHSPDADLCEKRTTHFFDTPFYILHNESFKIRISRLSSKTSQTVTSELDFKKRQKNPCSPFPNKNQRLMRLKIAKISGTYSGHEVFPSFGSSQIYKLAFVSLLT